MKDLNIKDAYELQSYFIRRMDKYLMEKGRILVGWDEILEGGISDNAVIMSWRGNEGALDAISQNHNAIMSNYYSLYFDQKQGPETNQDLFY